MQLRHISPRSSEWVDAMDEGGRGWEKLAPEELEKLRVSAQASGLGERSTAATVEIVEKKVGADADYGLGADSASR